jgi:polysaccharide export outer membrane protein
MKFTFYFRAKFWTLAWLVLIASPLFGQTASKTNGNILPAASSYVLDDKHKLAIGDRLSFRILEDLDDPKSLTVTDSGELEVPYVGRVPAESKTCSELGKEIKAALEKDYYIHATVIIALDAKAKSLGKVYIVGPVHTPGPQEIPTDEVLTLSKAILRAGGFAEYADKRNVRVTRKSRTGDKDTVFTVNVGEVLEKGKMESDLPLEAGDLIFVPEKLVRF